MTIAVPLDGGVYERGSNVPASWACIDLDGAGDIDPNPTKTFATRPVGLPIDTGGLGLKSFTATCADLTGYSVSKTVSYTIIDSSPPVVTIAVPKDGATYDQGQVVSPSYACTDPDDPPEPPLSVSPAPNCLSVSPAQLPRLRWCRGETTWRSWSQSM